MNNYTITETYTLPSKGLIYKQKVNPEVQLRSMLTSEEMKRLSPSDYEYKNLCEIMDSCIVSKLGISAYDLCLGDYQFLLHKLRTITYGSEYKMSVRCPYCGAVKKLTLNLDDLKTKEYDEKLKSLFSCELKMTKHKVTLNFMTPRLQDEILKKEKDYEKEHPDCANQTLVFTLYALIDTVDGMILSVAEKESFVRKLPMGDANIILRYAEKFNNEVGLDPSFQVECDQCGEKFGSSFRYTSEFFGPTVDFGW